MIFKAKKEQNLHFLKICGIIVIVACKNSNKRRVYNILKLKSKFKTVTKEMARVLKIMILGFILIIAIIEIKYKPVYEVKIADQTLGYVQNEIAFKALINEQIINKEVKNVDNISFSKEPQYEMKLLQRTQNTNEEEIIAKLDEEKVVTYKFYAVNVNGKNKAYVDTVEEAEEVVEKMKKDHKKDDIKLDIAINEKYTQKLDEVKTDKIEVAEKSVEKEIEHLLDEKEAKEAIAVIEGINVSVLPVSGRISSRFGASSSIRSGAHTGLDIACSTGTAIKVVAKGTVVFAQYNGPYGNLVKIDHGNGVETWYAHCSKIYAKVGEKVKAGDNIAAVGSTGNSTGSHLHLEVRIKGVAINPQKYLYK